MRKRPASILRLLLPSYSDILWIGAFLAVISLGPRLMNIDGDLGRHLTIGGYILDHGQVPTHDLFSHTMLGAPVTPHEWLAQVIFAAGYRMMGLDGVVLVCALVIAFTFWVVYRCSREMSQGVLPAVLMTLLAMAASSLHWLTRPHVFTFLFLALWISVLEDLRRGRHNRWWLLPALMLAWANLHGAFIAGFVTWGIYAAGVAWDLIWKRFPEGEAPTETFWRSYLLGGGTALLATLANPSGLGLWGTSVGYIGNRYLVGHTQEYLPPNFHDPSTWPFLVMVGLLVVLLGLQSRRVETSRILLAAAWLVMGLYSARNVPLFAIASAPLLAGVLGGWLADNRHRRPFLDRLALVDRRIFNMDLSLGGSFWIVAAFLLVVVAFRSGVKLDLQQRGNTFDPQVFPVQAVDWLSEHPQVGNMFNHFPWGGYLLYRGWPQERVFIDAQTDFYGEELTRQYEQVLTVSPGWEEILQVYEVRWVIVPPSTALAAELRARPDWQVVYQDETAEIFNKGTEQ